MSKANKTLLLIDGNSLFHRAYHALPPLSDKTGENANAVFGFSNMLLKAISEVKPDFIACAFDTKAPTFRHVEFEKYKAQRPAPPPDLYPQLPKVKKVLDAFGIKYFEKEGYEADDVIATLAMKCQMSNVKCQIIILSSDRDVLQLVDGNIKVQQPGWNLKEVTLIGTTEVKEKYGLEPHQMVDYKSLIGDVSDNIPGIAGIGPKTAAQLLAEFHTLEKLFENLDQLAETTKAKLEAGRDIALAAKKLVELDRNVDIEFRVEGLGFSPDWGEVKKAYEGLGFRSIYAKIEKMEAGKKDIVGIKDNEGTEDIKGKKTDNQLTLI
ncbi:5'-3' exonuclease [Candidatus Curtissbacteria bacterium]|nr:5'-3' exonuclease [Candidatus Curtissbacteria bacterium]